MSATEIVPPTTLIADDQPDVLEALRLLLKSAGIQTEAVTSPAAALAALERRRFDLLLMDLNYARDTTSGREGLDLLARVKAIDSSLPVVVMTAWGSIEVAIEAMHRGVQEFVLKPWENNRLVATVRTQIENGRNARGLLRLAAEREQELEDAREIQKRLLPRDLPSFPGYEISSAWQPARTVGGDYYDIFKLSERRLAVCIADVSGKGMPAALLMSNVQAAVRAFASDETPPARLCERLNRMVSANTERDRFITFFYGVVDVETGRFAYSNAGHNPPMLLRSDGKLERLDCGGPVLGPLSNHRYEQAEISFGGRDRMVLFTDGITEARNPEGDEFGEAQLIDLVVGNRPLDSAALKELMIETVGRFGGGSLDDDATLIVLSSVDRRFS
jgi:phosphoserine phosphatase RsbU/P